MCERIDTHTLGTMDTMYLLGCILGTHVMRQAVEVCNDSKTAFRIAVALGKKDVEAFPIKWKPKTLKVGDVLLCKMYMGGRGGLDTFDDLPLDNCANWSVVTRVSKTEKKITVQGIERDVILDKENGVVKIKPIMAVGICFEHYSDGYIKVQRFGAKQVIRDMTSLHGPMFLETRWRGFRMTYETVDVEQYDNDGYITVPVLYMS